MDSTNSFLRLLALICVLLQFLSRPVISAVLSPTWNETRILFYGDETVTYGYLMDQGFISIFTKTLSGHLKGTEGVEWNNVTVVQKDDMRSASNEFQDAVEQANATLVFLDFGLSEVINGNYTLKNLGSYRFYLDMILRTATEMNLTVVVISPALHGDSVNVETEEFLIIERIVGISGTLAGQYKSTFVDIFTTIYSFLAQYNKYGISENVVTQNGYILNYNGNMIIASKLLDLFGIQLEGSSFGELAAATPVLRTTRFADTIYAQYLLSQQSKLSATSNSDNALKTSYPEIPRTFESDVFSGFPTNIETNDIETRTRTLLDEDSFLSSAGDE